MRQIVLDTETTGLETSSGHKIIEVAAVELQNRRLTGDTYHRLINPQREIDAESYKIHKISNAQLANKPLFVDIAESFIEYIKDSEVIIHNAPFDIGFINEELKATTFNNFETYTSNIVDSLAMAKQLRPGQRNNLDSLCRYYDFDISEREEYGHNALLDCRLTAQVFLAMTSGQMGFDFEPTQRAGRVAIKDTELTIEGNRLRIIKASDEEIRQHNKVLDDLERELDKDGKIQSVWRRLESSSENIH